MANKFQTKRTTISGRTPNTTNSSNSAFIDTGELALNLTDGKMFSSNGTAYFEVGANLTNLSVTGNSSLAAIVANGSIGGVGQTLTSNGSGIYWAAGAGTGTVTQVDTGVGLSGGPITGTGTISVVANSGIVANTTGIFANPGTGLVVNTTGIHVNSTYIGTLTSNNSTNLNGQPASFYTNATNIIAGTLGAGRLPQANTTSNGAVVLLDSVTNTSISIYAPTANAVKTSYDAAISANTRAASAQTAAASAYTNAVSYVDGKSFVNTSQLSANLSNYQTTAGLSANVATLISNNSTNLNGQPASFYTNATNISTGTLGFARLPSLFLGTTSIQSTSAAQALSGITTLAAGNTTISGFANISTSVNSALLTVGTAFIANTTAMVITTPLTANSATGTSGQILASNGTVGSPYWITPAVPVTSVTGTSPVDSSGGTTPTISLASGYGDTQNPYASKTAKFILAAPNAAAGVPTFRAIVASDIPTLNQSTTGSAATLTTGRTIALTGDVSYTSGSFNGSGNVTGTATLASVGTAGTYTKVTTDAKGRVTSGTTLAATDIPSLDASKITSGTIDAARLPSYVDDVIEAANLASFPSTGETGKIYIALDTNKAYRWSGSVYVFITSGAVDSVAGKTGVVTLVKGDVGLGSVDNTADSAKSVLEATRLTTARTIGGVSFNGTANINLPGVNAVGNQNTTGSAATLTTSRTIAVSGAVTGTATSFNGSADITIPTTVSTIQGGIVYGSNTTAYDTTAAGTTGQLLVSNGTSAPTWNIPTLELIPDSTFKRSTKCATTANITLSGTQTIDGVAVIAGDRVLVKNQTTGSQNGIYVVAAGAWSRALDADVSSEIGGAVVAVDAGTLNGGEMWTTTFKTTDTIGTTSMLWREVVYNSGTWAINVSGSAATLTTARTLTLGATGKTFNGSANVSWTRNEIIGVPPVSGDWFNGNPPVVGNDGVMEVGRYIDFHSADTGTSDFDARIECTALNALTFSGSTIAAGNTTVTGFVNASASVNSALLTVGTSFIANTSQMTLTGIPLSANGSTGTAGHTLHSNGTTGSPYWAVDDQGVTSVTGTSPVVSSGGATPAISLAAGYGDTLNPYASKTAHFILAAPNGTAGVPTFRAVVAADIPTLNQSTTGSAATLTTGRTIGMTGDVTYTSASFNGSTNVTGTATLASVGTAGTYTKVTTDAKGRVTSGTTLTEADIPELTLAKLPGSTYKQSVVCATTANITLSGTQTIDGVAVIAGNRVLVKNQTTASQNGIYVVAAGAWTRALDADASSEIGAAVVAVDTGTLNGGEMWTTTFRTTDTLGTTSMPWYEVLFNNGTWGISISGSAATLTTGRTIALTGDVSYTSGSFNGSAAVTGTATLASVGTAGTYTKVTTDAKGRVTSGTTLAAGDIPTLNQSTTGSAATLTTGRTIALSGAATGTATSFNGSANITIPVTGLNASNLSSGTVPTARLGTGTANSTTFLAGDQTYKTISAGGSTTISATPPASPANGDLWWDSDTGRLYIYYVDGTSNQWVDASPSIPGPAGVDGVDGADGAGFTSSTNGQINSLGVGTPPSNVTGEIRAAGTITAFYSSDERIKTNIKIIDNPLNKLLELNGVTFSWTEEEKERRGGVDGKFVRSEEVGVIAQDVEKVLPQVVAERPDGYKAVRYEMLVPLLIESIKEQQTQIEDLRRIVEGLNAN